MKKRLLIVGSIVVSIVCIILILSQIFGFLLINSNGRRSVDIDDNNRGVIGQLISKNIETDETLPNMDRDKVEKKVSSSANAIKEMINRAKMYKGS